MRLFFKAVAAAARPRACGLGLAVALVMPAFAQGPAGLALTPANPLAGQPVTLHYHPAGTELAGKPPGTVKVYYWTGGPGRPKSKEVPATGSPADWQATLEVPADTKVLVVQLVAPGADTPPASPRYVVPVYGGQQPVAGALGTEALIYSRGLGVPEDSKRALALLRKELALYPASKPKFSDNYYQLLAASKVPADQAELARVLPRLQQSPQESDRMMAIDAYTTLKQTAKAEALLAATKKAFPKGALARLASLEKLYDEENPARMQAKYDAFVQTFPESQAAPDARILYDYARFSLARTYALAGQMKQAEEALALVRNPEFRPDAYGSIAEELLKQGHPAEVQALLAKTIAGYQADAAAGKPGDEANYVTCLTLYSQALYQQQQYPEALTYARQAYERSTKKTPDIQEAYGLALTANQQGAAALPLLEALVKTGQASAAVKKALQPAYVQAKGSPAGYDTYLADLKSALSAHTRASLAGQMVHKPAPNFTLKDLQGNAVSLSALKGKVVVLDFWATWCGPCKKSFPAMQQAVEKYRDNPNVVFLFIDTWERVPNPQENAAKFIAENKYPFRVLLDLKDPVTKKTAVVESFGISGIPSKFVIGPDGLIRFALTGFTGGDDAAVEELSAMIELAAGKS